MALNTKKLAEYARLRHAIKKLDAKHKELYAKAEKMQQGLIDNMIDNEVDKVSLKGGTILYISELIWAKYVKDPETEKTDKPKVINALKNAGLGWLVQNNYNSQSVSAYLRELDESGKELPKEFKGVIESNPVTKLVAKKV